MKEYPCFSSKSDDFHHFRFGFISSRYRFLFTLLVNILLLGKMLTISLILLFSQRFLYPGSRHLYCSDVYNIFPFFGKKFNSNIRFMPLAEQISKFPINMFDVLGFGPAEGGTKMELLKKSEILLNRFICSLNYFVDFVLFLPIFFSKYTPFHLPHRQISEQQLTFNNNYTTESTHIRHFFFSLSHLLAVITSDIKH